MPRVRDDMTDVAPAFDARELDRLLAGHAFGNSRYITGQLHVCYRRRLERISKDLAGARRLNSSLNDCTPYGRYRVIGDTVVRCAVQHALRQLELGTPYGLPLEQCEEILADTHLLVARGAYGPLGYKLASRVCSRPRCPWIWDDQRSEDVFVRAFRSVVEDNYGGLPCSLTPDELASVRRGVDLLTTLLPLSSKSALSHTHLLAVFAPTGSWSSRSSSSEYRISGTVFLSRRLLRSPWWIAEYLYHETLHQQLYDFRQGHSLLEPDFDRDGAPTVCSPWNLPGSNQDNYWDVHRSLAAFHVYVHLALLAIAAEQRAHELEPIYGKQAGLFRMTTSRTALARAQYLGEQIRERFWDELGIAGKRLMEWFSSVLEVLDPSPPPKGSSIHLLLDRYGREAKEVEFLLNPNDGPSDLTHQLLGLLQDESDTVRRILTTLDAESKLQAFNDTIGPMLDEASALAHERPGALFASARGIIFKTILGVSPDGYTLASTGVPDHLVIDMVEGSSKALTMLLHR